MIDFKRKIIFIHVAKTGGSSVSEFYKKYSKLWTSSSDYNTPFDGNVHASTSDLKSAGLILDNFYKFSICRNPIDYIRSSWNEWYFENSFEDFILSGQFKEIPTQHSHWVVDGVISIDKLFLFEDLKSIFSMLSNILNVPGYEPLHINRSIHPIDVPENLCKIITQQYKEDYNIYKCLKMSYS